MARSFASKTSVLMTLFCLVGACSVQPAATDPTATTTADGAKGRTQCPDGTLVAWNKTCAPAPVVSPVVQVPSASAATYDTSIGAGVDADGYAQLPLRAGAHRYFVRSTGSNGNSCSAAQNPATPLKTIAAGIACVTKFAGDQVLLAEGSTFDEAIPYLLWKSGYSFQYPMVIQSYDPSDPTNEAKFGRGDQRNARPILTAVQGQVTNNNDATSFLAIRGLDFNPGNVANAGMLFASMTDGLLIENNLLRYTSFGFNSTEAQNVLPTLQHLIFRNNASYGQWNPINGRTGGFYVSGVAGVTVEDNVFYHCGWKIGANRDDDMSIGGPTWFGHPIYLQTNTNGVVRRNLTMDSADTATARGNILWTENVALRDPSGIGLGNSTEYNTDRPNGINIEGSYNLLVGATDLNSTNPRGLGFTTANGRAGSKVHHNLLIDSGVSTGVNAQMFSNYAAFNQPSYMTFEYNVGVRWNPLGQTFYAAGGAFPTQALPYTTYANNKWADPSSGTNVNSAALAFANAYTETALYAAVGYSSYDALVADAIVHPEKHLQRNLRALAFTGYGM